MRAEHADLARAFAEQTWPHRIRSDAFYRWRYRECPVLAGYLAIRNGECVAMTTALQRPYRIGGEIVEVRESFDWFTLPRYKGAGIGVRVMQRMMEDPQPITVIGGTEDTREFLPKLGFFCAGHLQTYALPLGSRRASVLLRERFGVPTIATRIAHACARPWLLAPRPRRVPPGGRAIAVGGIGAEALALYARAGYGAIPQWRSDDLGWLTHGFAATGAFTALYFARGEELLGWSLLRVHLATSGCEAQIVDLFAPEPDSDLFTWMVSETCCIAAGFGPDVVSAFTTSPQLGDALRRNRFRAGAALPIHWWDREREALPSPLFFGGQWGDLALLPFPERWWDA